MSTSTLEAAIGSITTLFNGYLGVLITSYLPTVLGVLVIIGVVGFIIWGLMRLFRHKGK
jgi:hypothetical protein